MEPGEASWILGRGFQNIRARPPRHTCPHVYCLPTPEDPRPEDPFAIPTPSRPPEALFGQTSVFLRPAGRRDDTVGNPHRAQNV